jgi:RNA polymerase sigma-70 factor (ECF subfamily)
MKDFDPEWIQKIKNKDQRLMTMLYNKYCKLIYNTIYAITKSTELTEDLTNDAFIKIFENIEKYRTDTSFQSWIKAMATNLTIDYYRKPSTKQTDNSIDDTTTSEVVTDFTDPESSIIAIENMEVLKASLKRLTPGHAKVLELRFFNKLSYAEIAAELNQPIGTIKGTLHKAKYKLKQLVYNN